MILPLRFQFEANNSDSIWLMFDRLRHTFVVISVITLICKSQGLHSCSLITSLANQPIDKQTIVYNKMHCPNFITYLFNAMLFLSLNSPFVFERDGALNCIIKRSKI